MKISALVLFAALAAAPARAVEIHNQARIPVNCENEHHLRPVSILSVSPAAAGNGFDLVVTYGACSHGQFFRREITTDYNFYLINMEYSADVRSDYKLLNNEVVAHMTYDPQGFFAGGNIRHLDVSFYPDGGATGYGWQVTFIQDPATGKVTVWSQPNN